VLDLKVIAVVSTLTRAGTVVVFVAVLGIALIASDSALTGRPLPLPLPAINQGVPILLPDPNDREIGRGVSEGIIPLGRSHLYVPILMYHYIQDLPRAYDQLTFNLTVTPAHFTLQMQWLATHGYHSITFDDLRAYFGGETDLPSKPVVITLDDGYRDLYTTAYPVLAKFGLKAVAYIVTSFVNRPRYVTTSMILEMDRNGIEIASHTVDHANIAHENVPEITYEVLAAKQWLENLLGHPVVDFAYPSGRFNATDEQVLADEGYSTATTEQEGTYRAWATRYEWPRTRVSGGVTLAEFIKNLGPVEPFVIVAPADG
jgi:peptidoglycan/xylan/chitin deacetylase (PgdA/CDA1 family)